MPNDNTHTLLPCPFCGDTPAPIEGSLAPTPVNRHFNDGCPLSGLIFTDEEWNTRTPAPMNDNTHTQADWLYRTIAVNLLRATKAGDSLHEFADRLERDIRDHLSRTPAEPKAGDWEKELKCCIDLVPALINAIFELDSDHAMIEIAAHAHEKAIRALSSAAPRITENQDDK